MIWPDSGAKAPVVAAGVGKMIPTKLPWELMNPKLAAELNPFLANPILNGHQIAVTMKAGDNVINHGLGGKLTGWIVVGNNAPTTFYDKQASNQQPDLTLVLNASGACSIMLYVY
jgi:hypothetical protein